MISLNDAPLYVQASITNAMRSLELEETGAKTAYGYGHRVTDLELAVLWLKNHAAGLESALIATISIAVEARHNEIEEAKRAFSESAS